jgi:DNA integrity scanning protein DisA with diadenylate cyclase activity
MLSNITFEGLLDLDAIARLVLERNLEESVSAKGFRFFSNLNLEEKDISMLIDEFGSLNKIFSASSVEISRVINGQGERIKEDISNLREQILSGKAIF